jgi:putative Mn2+ efflux pump MntP
MKFYDLILLAVGLSMDAFAVSICKGLSVRRVTKGQMLTVGGYFGVFQALMPLLGYLLARLFAAYIASVDHWVTFGLLTLIGANMIREAIGDEEGDSCPNFNVTGMLPLALATSIDAMAVGVTFAMNEVNIPLAIALIGGITFVVCAVGVRIGNLLGARFQSRAELVGGLVLIGMGLKFLLQDLGVFG